MKKITIDPVTRLEGHGKIELFLDEHGELTNAYFQVPELRGFEQFCIGRLAEDMPVITSRICGVCPEAHLIASAKALDDVFDVEPPLAGKMIRELLYMAFFITDHTTHFYAFGGPDFIIGPDAPPGERNMLGVFRKVGLDVGNQVIACRTRNHHLIKMLGGRGIHPTGALPGGWSKSICDDERRQAEIIARENIEFALFSLKLFEDLVLKNKDYYELVTNDTYLHKTYYMGTVNGDNKLALYDGKIRVIDPCGDQYLTYPPKDYLLHIAERVEPWTYLKFPYLKAVGWKGFIDGPDSGVYCATPLARLNVSDSMATPLAQEHFIKFYETFNREKVNGKYRPVHHRLATHWARLIEMLYAAERMLELATHPDITSPQVRVIPKEIKGEGIGSVEAPRGTLIHHYKTDKQGRLLKVNLIVGTTNNYAPMSMSIKKAAEQLIAKNKVIEEGLLNRIEMAFRLYDPCLSCATHHLPGKMPLEVLLKDSQGDILGKWSRD